MSKNPKKMTRPLSFRTVIYWLISIAMALGILVLIVASPTISRMTNLSEGRVENHFIQHDGEPFFPIGIYHVSWAGTQDDKLIDLQSIADGGFNTIHPALTSDDSDFMDLAATLGIRVLPENDDGDGLEQLIEVFGDHPALLGWSIADDFNDPHNDNRPVFIQSQEDLVRSQDSEGYTYITGVTSPYRFRPFLGITDIVSVQTYSVPFEALNKTYEHTSTLRRASYNHDQTIFTNVQSFAYPEERTPTHDELRNMTYQALLAGTDGIIYYTYLDINWHMPDHPETWSSLTSVVQELNDLMPFWLSGSHRQINTNQFGVEAGLWINGNQQLLVIVNTNQNELDLNISLPSTLSFQSTTTPYDADDSLTIHANSNSLSGTIAANDTQVFIFENEDNQDS